MPVELVLQVGYETIKTVILVGAPIMLVGLVVGLAVSIFQATTQINEMTLTFIPKMLAIYISLVFFAAWIIEKLLVYTKGIFSNFNQIIG